MEYYKELSLDDIVYFCNIENSLKKELWLPVVGYEGIYEVSNLGRIKSLSRLVHKKNNVFRRTNNRIMTICVHKHGYIYLILSINKSTVTAKVHSLVACAFLGHVPNKKHDLVVDHIDNNKRNNCLSNLQVISQRENVSKDIKNKTSLYTGVSWDKVNKKWLSQIVINRKTINLGRYVCELKAKEVYDNKLKTLHEITCQEN